MGPPVGGPDTETPPGAMSDTSMCLLVTVALV